MNLNNALLMSAIACVLLEPASTWAQAKSETSGQYSFKTIGDGFNTRVGKTLDVVYKLIEPPKSGFTSAEGIQDYVALCKSSASSQLDAYLSKTNSEMPKYFSITIQSAGQLGTYVRLYFKGTMDCIPQKLSTLN
jgi:hypothetical protein